MATGKFVSYLRVSTDRQGVSGLGLAAQRKAVDDFLNGGRWSLLAEFVEVESGRKSDKERPQLRAALDLCRKEKATLVVGKLDRLSRDVEFLMNIRNGNVPVKACDMPDAGLLEFGIRAVFAQHEREEISKRTKAALAAAKARGVVLGVTGPANLKRNIEERQQHAAEFARKVAPVLLGLKARGLSQRDAAEELNKLGVAAPRGGRWHLSTVQRIEALLRPEQRVAELAQSLQAEGMTPRAIVKELARRGLFAAESKVPTMTPTNIILLGKPATSVARSKSRLG